MDLPSAPQIVAALAPLLNTVEHLPQLYKTYQMKDVKDFSLLSLILLLVTNLLWLLHGYFIGDTSLILSSGASAAVHICMLVLFMRYSASRALV